MVSLRGASSWRIKASNSGFGETHKTPRTNPKKTRINATDKTPQKPKNYPNSRNNKRRAYKERGGEGGTYLDVTALRILIWSSRVSGTPRKTRFSNLKQFPGFSAATSRSQRPPQTGVRSNRLKAFFEAG